jgi:hypothetical protein
MIDLLERIVAFVNDEFETTFLDVLYFGYDYPQGVSLHYVCLVKVRISSFSIDSFLVFF